MVGQVWRNVKLEQVWWNVSTLHMYVQYQKQILFGSQIWPVTFISYSPNKLDASKFEFATNMKFVIAMLFLWTAIFCPLILWV